jgi:hypothetical protein
MQMKRILKITAILFVLILVAEACNHYVCPAYTNDTLKNKTLNEVRS